MNWSSLGTFALGGLVAECWLNGLGVRNSGSSAFGRQVEKVREI